MLTGMLRSDASKRRISAAQRVLKYARSVPVGKNEVGAFSDLSTRPSDECADDLDVVFDSCRCKTLHVDR